VSIAAGLSGDPQGAPVAALLDRYFTAINSRDYQGYLSLLTARKQQGMNIASFDNGYRSTVDSGEELVSISPQADGTTQALVTFVSHQNPADSVDHQQSCTQWRVTLFLVPDGSGGFLIDMAPSGHEDSYVACH
jgi:hypothetical protein